MTDTNGPPALPRRDPRPLFVHFAVDTAVAFLGLVIVLLILDASIWVIVGVAVVVGALAAPFTRQAEARALEARYATGGGNPID